MIGKVEQDKHVLHQLERSKKSRLEKKKKKPNIWVPYKFTRSNLIDYISTCVVL